MVAKKNEQVKRENQTKKNTYRLNQLIDQSSKVVKLGHQESREARRLSVLEPIWDAFRINQARRILRRYEVKLVIKSFEDKDSLDVWDGVSQLHRDDAVCSNEKCHHCHREHRQLNDAGIKATAFDWESKGELHLSPREFETARKGDYAPSFRYHKE